MAEETAARLGTAIARSRRKLGLKQSELADLTGLDRPYVSQLERGKVTQHLERLVRVLDALGLELKAVERDTGAVDPHTDSGRRA